MRPPKPDFLVQYEEWLAQGPPQCCHTCDHLGGNGQCFIYNQRPPDEFFNTENACDLWERNIPF